MNFKKGLDKVVVKVDKGIVEGFKKTGKILDSTLSKKLKYKVSKSQKMTAQIDEFKAPSVLGDENRFFNKTMEEEKKKLFFS